MIYPNVEIGNNVIIHAGAVIGADGFGFVRTATAMSNFRRSAASSSKTTSRSAPTPASTAVRWKPPIIRRGTKLDNLIQIAHNVEIGEHTVIAAQTGISGSSTVGDHSILGGQVGIGEHARLDAEHDHRRTGRSVERKARSRRRSPLGHAGAAAEGISRSSRRTWPACRDGLRK